jgi:uncharacterized membrane protein
MNRTNSHDRHHNPDVHEHESKHRMLTGLGVVALGAAGLAFARRRKSVPPWTMALAAAPLAYAALGGRARMGRSSTREALGGDRGVHVRDAVRIERPIAEVYHFWRRLENLPQFMSYLHSVEELDGRLSRWVAVGPGGAHISWDAEIINDVEPKVIGWQSLPGGAISTAGSVNFDAVRGGRSTQVTVHLQYAPVAGRWGDRVARLFGKAPSQTIREDLRRLKQLLEAGEIAQAGLDEHSAQSTGGW